MNFTIICIGKLKEKFWRDACFEYSKRLGRFGKLEIIELPESAADDVNEESAALIARLPKAALKIALDIKADSMSSEQFAARLGKAALEGCSRVAFIIGGSNGYNDSVRERCDISLSFSSFTFPHQLMRVVLLEQIYRACKINAGETYHK